MFSSRTAGQVTNRLSLTGLPLTRMAQGVARDMSAEDVGWLARWRGRRDVSGGYVSLPDHHHI